MRKDPTEFRKRFAAWQDGKNPYSAGRIIDAIYKNNPKEEFLGEPSHNYDFTQSEEWANARGYYPDERGHRDDRVKKPAHPSHSSRGTWDGDKFVLTDKGMQDPNYTLFGLNDGGLDPQAILTYKGSTVLPEMTVTPKGNYIYNSYDNIKLHLPKHRNGELPRYEDGKPIKVGNYNIYPSAIGASELSVTTPEIVVTGKDRRPSWKKMYQNPHLGDTSRYYNGNALEDVVSFVPGVGDAVDAVKAVDAANKGEYLHAGMLGAGLLIPNALEKPAKLGIKFLKNLRTDYKYLKAIKNIHPLELKRLRDEHFLENAPSTVYRDNKPKTLYHGTPTKGWNKYEEKFFGRNTDDGYYGKGLYLSEDKSHAAIYKDDGEIKELYLNAQHPFYSGQIGTSFNEATFRGNLAAWFNQPNSINLAKDEASITNYLSEKDKQKILDDFFKSDVSSHVEKGILQHIAVPISNMMKYASPITRDDSGKLIKLSKRDNFNNPDFRY